MDLIRKLEEFRAQEQALAWEGTFAEYFELVKQNPHVVQLSHARVFNMIMAEGVEVGKRGETRYNFFNKEIFGLDRPLQQIVEYFNSAAQRLEVRKRILLLMGPVGGGKSTIVSMLKHGLEQYSRSERGAIYAISSCPMHEEPLHLIPLSLRPDFEREYGIYIEGDLCPRCRYDLDHTWDGHIERVPVRRMALSEKNRVGIGTFTPSDPKCVVGDTLLLTSLGMVRFDELQQTVAAPEDQFVPLVVDVSGRAGLETTSHFYNGGERATRRLRTRLGYEIEGSLVHPVLVMRHGGEAWVPLADVQIGDHVALQRGSALFGNTTRLPEFTNRGLASRGQNTQLTLPTVLDADLARLLGYIVAEGSLTDTAVWLTNGDRRVLDDIHAICERLFQVRPKEYGKAGTAARSVTISSIRLVRWLEEVCGITRGAAHKVMPRVIRMAPRPLVLAFLEGLFWGDGTISARQALGSNRFKYASASPELARQVQTMLLNMGVVAALYTEHIQGRFTAYAVVVQGDGVVDLLDLIPGLRAKSTQHGTDLVPRRGSTNFDHIPQMQEHVQALMDSAAYGKKAPLTAYSRYATTAAWGRGLTYPAATRLIATAEQTLPNPPPALAALKEHVAQRYLWLEVQAITEGCAPVYDLTVPGTHSFCANGFLNHNSQDISELVGSIDLSTIGEVGAESDPRAYRFDGELNIANRGLMEFVELLKCLSGDTLVYTNQGIRRLDSFAQPDHPAGISRAMEISLATSTGVETASDLYHAGVEPTKRLTTRRGYAVAGTGEHRVRVVDENGVQVWRRLDEMQIGDWVVMQKGANLWGGDVPIQWQSTRRQSTTIRTPEKMTPDLARWLGYLVAEGDTCPDGAVRFTNGEPELREDYCRIAQDLFGVKTQLYTTTIQISSVALLDLLEYLGFHTGATNKEVPWSVLQSSRECALEFLRGYFAGDGTVRIQGGLSWTTASARLAEQLQVLLLNLGVVSRRFTTQQKAGKDGQPTTYWNVMVNGADADRLVALMPLLPTRKHAMYVTRSAQQPRVGRADLIPHTAGYWMEISDELQRTVIARAQAVGGPGYREREGAYQILGE
ncbi:MAG TPA: LAGLIDADG family homing endonuclease, partial [Chloroflexia bacterium]|nr:LAGLIDADG family homing endonuclease [Chloroflexia bacterium]